MTKLILATFATIAIGAAASSANAGIRLNNGTQLTGVAAVIVSTATVKSVVLPSGETVKLR
jgi:hypothetical protein